MAILKKYFLIYIFFSITDSKNKIFYVTLKLTVDNKS